MAFKTQKKMQFNEEDPKAHTETGMNLKDFTRVRSHDHTSKQLLVSSSFTKQTDKKLAPPVEKARCVRWATRTIWLVKKLKGIGMEKAAGSGH